MYVIGRFNLSKKYCGHHSKKQYLSTQIMGWIRNYYSELMNALYYNLIKIFLTVYILLECIFLTNVVFVIMIDAYV